MNRDWQQEVLGFSFADPWFLLFIPLVIALWILTVRRRRAAIGFVSSALLDGLPKTARMRFGNMPRHLVALGLLPLCFAIARPQRLERVAVPTEGIDIMLCLDLSSSMSSAACTRAGNSTSTWTSCARSRRPIRPST